MSKKKKKKLSARSDFKAPQKVKKEPVKEREQLSSKKLSKPKRNPLLAIVAYLWAALLLFGSGLICVIAILPIANYLDHHFPQQSLSRGLMILSVLLFILIAKSLDSIAAKHKWIERMANSSMRKTPKT